MRGRPFEVAWRAEDTAEALKAAYQQERDRQRRTRLHGLWLLRCGWVLSGVAGALGVHYRSVQRWTAWYRQGGVSKVLSRKMGGKGQVSFLSRQAQERVAREVATGRFRTAAEIGDWIAGEYGVTYKRNGIYSLMHRLGCSPKVPRPMHAKADQKQQASWKKGGLLKPSQKQE